jgi:hypothetical protein
MDAPITALRAAVRFAARDLAPSTERVPGVTLALYRVAAGVPAVRLASHMDVSKQYISKLETEGATISSAGSYRVAVDDVAAIMAQR